MRKILEVCKFPTRFINRFCPFTSQDAKQAVIKNEIDILRNILQNNNLQKTFDSSDLLLLAVSQGQEQIAILLIDEFLDSVDINKRNERGDTIFMIAIFRQLRNVIEKIHPLIDVSHYEQNKNTAFIAAAANGDLRTLKLLLQYKNNDPLAKNSDGQTALHRACYFGQIDVVRYLLKNTLLKISQVDKKGNNSLHLAAMGLNIALTRYIMKKLVNSQKLLVKNKQDKTPLDIIEDLISKISQSNEAKSSINLDHLKISFYKKEK